MINDFAAKLRRTLRRRGLSHHDAEDCVQDAFLKLERYRQANPVEKPDGFVVRAALNAATDLSRSPGYRKTFPLDQDFSDDCALPDEVVSARESLRQLSRHLGKLNPRARRILIACRLNGQSYEAIARTEGVTVFAVEKSISRSVSTLVSLMQGEA